jgi:hypothetical protein
MPDPFPVIKRELQKSGGKDGNPAIQLFGRRFFSDQTVPELLIEFLLLTNSQKRIGKAIIDKGHVFPDIDVLKNWPPETSLEYAPKSRLNLKLFALIGASKLETRHKSHRDHYRQLLQRIQERIIASGSADKEEILKTLENLFLGFQRVGGQRTWCAQSFLPIHPEMLAAEILWNSTKAKKAEDWDEITERFNHFFTANQHRFLARGGELLYLQLCNLLMQSSDTIRTWCKDVNVGLDAREMTPALLAGTLSEGLNKAVNSCPSTVGVLAKFIDTGAEPETAKRTDYQDGEPRYVQCGWCPAETWQESLLFAVELLRLCDATIDPVERIYLLETACAMQVLRSLCAQSARYADHDDTIKQGSGALNYVWAFSDPEGRSDTIKRISRRSVSAIQRLIQKAIRHPDILKNIKEQKQREGIRWKDPYKEADRRYGHKLFLTLAKRLGMIVPRRGTGARFVLTDHLLRYLVLTIIRPGERMTYDTFKKQIFQRHGMAFDDEHLRGACRWCGTRPLTTLGDNIDKWLTDMLSSAGMLVQLSDSCSMVENPFTVGRENHQ